MRGSCPIQKWRPAGPAQRAQGAGSSVVRSLPLAVENRVLLSLPMARRDRPLATDTCVARGRGLSEAGSDGGGASAGDGDLHGPGEHRRDQVL